MSDHRVSDDAMLIDCGTCRVRDIACGDCVVSVLLGVPEPVAMAGPEVVPVEPVRLLRLAGREPAALRALADSGLVPPLRHDVGDDGIGRRARGASA